MIPLEQIYFGDMESVPGVKTPEGSLKELFEDRFRYLIEEKGMGPQDVWNDKAALYAEHGKVVCVSLGKMSQGKFYVKSYYGMREKVLLSDVVLKLTEIGQDPNLYLCGHNLKEFDAQFLFRRMMINDLNVPDILNNQGKKPWDIKKLLDTMEMWACAQYSYKASLDLCCQVLGIPSPKAKMSGADVRIKYDPLYDAPADELIFDVEKKVFDDIRPYCEDDVIAGARLYCRLKGLPTIEDSQIVRMP